ncbi:MAG: YbhB/YbcL family Raf kinase inhibitor-like protein [Sulfurovaceae bacterium]|nr:YbhB/YbcL family Raf kinase inhibitor-like protein [Sulfurovaceae bacterium]
MHLLSFLTGIILSNTAFVAAGEFTLHSNDLSDQLTKTQEFSGSGCNGLNISPELYWDNVPKGTKSFAVTLYDIDARAGKGWWHWVVFDIPTSVSSLPTDFGNITKPHMINAIQSINNSGKTGYHGACPPEGDKPHRYVFSVYALNVDHLDLDKNTVPDIVGHMINIHTIKKATIVSYYGR